MSESSPRPLPSDFAAPNDAGVPEVTVVPLCRLAHALGCGLETAQGIARRDGMLLDAWKRPLGASFTFPDDHRFWIPEAWLKQTVAKARELA